MKKSSYKAILLFYVVLLFLFFLFLLIFCSFFQIFLSLDLLTFSFPFSIQGFPLPLPSRAASFSSLSPPPILPNVLPPYILLLFRLFLLLFSPFPSLFSFTLPTFVLPLLCIFVFCSSLPFQSRIFL